MVSSGPPARSALKDKVPTRGRVSIRKVSMRKSRVSSECQRHVNCELTTDIKAASSSPTGSEGRKEGLASNLGGRSDNSATSFTMIFLRWCLPASCFLFSNISSGLTALRCCQCSNVTSREAPIFTCSLHSTHTPASHVTP